MVALVVVSRQMFHLITSLTPKKTSLIGCYCCAVGKEDGPSKFELVAIGFAAVFLNDRASKTYSQVQ